MIAARPGSSNAATPKIKVRPPILFLAALLLGLALDHLLPLPVTIPRNDGLVHKLIPGVLLALGCAIFVAAVRNFARAETPVPGNRPVQALVTNGVHAWSRNPIYIGMLLVYLGIGVALRSGWILALGPLIAVVLRYAVIAREEIYLEQCFGNAYREYRSRVRRWL